MAVIVSNHASKSAAQTEVAGKTATGTYFAFWDDGTHHGIEVRDLKTGFGGFDQTYSTTEFEDSAITAFEWDGDDLKLKDAAGNVVVNILDMATALGLGNKVDKVTGKQLSTHDFTQAYKDALDGLQAALDAKVDVVAGKGLSTEDFTTALKTKLEQAESPLAKGYHDTLAALQAFASTPVANTFGYVKNGAGDYELQVYDGTNWVNKGVVSGSVTFAELKALIDADAGYHLLTDAQKTELDNLATNYVAVVAGKGLSTNDLTDTRKNKVDALPTAAANTAGGLAQIDSSGLLPEAILPPQVKQFTDAELDYIRENLAVDTWARDRTIVKHVQEATRGKDHKFSAKRWHVRVNGDEDMEIWYMGGGDYYPDTVKVDLHVKSYDAGKKQTKEKDYKGLSMSKGNSIERAWFNLQTSSGGYKDDWDINHGDTTTWTLTVRDPKQGNKYKQTVVIEAEDIGGRNIKYKITTTGDSLSDVNKIADNSEWK